MASEAELIEAIRNAGRAGDGEAVRALGRQLERQRSQSQPRPVNPVVNTAAGLAQGVAALPDMVTEGIAGLGRMVNAPVARAASGFYRAVGMDDAANRVDRNRQTFDRAWSQPATFGRAIESLAPTPQDGIGRAVRLASQVLGGMVVPMSPKAMSAVPPKLPRTPPSRPTRTTNFTPRRNPVTNMPEATGTPASSPVFPELAPMGRRAQVRAAQLRAAGVSRPTTGMVTRDPRVWRREQEFAKLEGVGDDFARQLGEVQTELSDNARRIIGRQGGALGPEEVGIRVQKALADKSDEMQQHIGGLYRQVRETRGNMSAGSLNKLRELLDDPEMMDNPAFDAMREGIMRRLQRFGMAGNSGLLRNNSIATIDQAEALRKMVGNLGDGKDPAIKMMRSRIIDTIDDDVVDAVGDDAFRTARDAARARFAEFKNTFAGKVAETDKPERLGRQIVGQGAGLNDLRSLVGSLTTGSDKQVARGQDALRALRAQTMDDLLRPAISMEGTINGGQVYKRFMENAARYREVLDPASYKELRRFAVAARNATSDVPMSNVNHSNSGSVILNGLIPGVKEEPAGILGRVARRVAGSLAGPGGGIAADASDAALREIANVKLAQEAQRQIALASDPMAAARAMIQRTITPEAAPSLDAVAKPYVLRGLLSGGNRASNDLAGLLNTNVPLRAAAGEGDEDKKKKKRRP